MRTFLCTVCAAAMLLIAAYSAIPSLEGEHKTFYGGRYSGAEMVSESEYKEAHGVLGLCINYFPVKAESAYFDGTPDIGEILGRYSARVVFEERVGDIVNYYCRSYSLPAGVRLKGKEINLHVAAGPHGYSVGTPIVYGGY